MMALTRTETLPFARSRTSCRPARRCESLAQEPRFGLVDQTKMVTAASELARNTVVYGGGGDLLANAYSKGPSKGFD